MRVPRLIYSEKVFCSLAKNLEIDNKIPKKNFKQAINVIKRFYKIAADIGSNEVIIFATAAVREAENGVKLKKEIESITKKEMIVLSENDEVKLSSQGVLSSFPNANGIIADLGGGSLELSFVINGVIQNYRSLKIGVVRFLNLFLKDKNGFEKSIKKELNKITWFKGDPDTTLYLVGGSFRSLAKLHIWATDYPLSIVHGYTIKKDEALNVIDLASNVRSKTIKEIPDIEQERSKTIPVAGQILKFLLKKIYLKKIIFCSQGLREGFIFSLLPPEEKKVDPLIFSSKKISKNFDNSFFDGELIFNWLQPIFQNENENFKRIRLALSHLSELSYWQNFKDIQANYALNTVLYYPFLSITHEQRVFLAMSIYISCGGKLLNTDILKFSRLLKKDATNAARVLGQSIKLSYLVSGGLYKNLEKFRIEAKNNEIFLITPNKKILKTSTKIQKTLKKISKLIRIKKIKVLEEK